MQKGKTVFLFGAGAGMPWHSPKTSDLTNLIRESGFKTTDNETYITQFIFDKLIENGYKETDINFETIINVIEEMIVYHSHFDSTKKLPSWQSCFFDPLFEEIIFNFSIKGGEIKHGYTLEIPKGVASDYARPAFHNEAPKQFFLQHLLSILITAINVEVSAYAYHTAGHSVIDKKSKASILFCKWMKSIAERNALRLYTLNYDRLFKILLEDIGIKVFEGFNCDEYIGPSIYLPAEVKKILTDSGEHVHYNLHGSVFWRLDAYDNEQLPNPEFFMTGAPMLPINDDHAVIQVEKGRNVMLTNIVTGYQKAQRTMVTPLKQMQAAFDKDCCFANEIYIVGYSLGDEHINESIKTALRHNTNVKIIIVDPFFMKNESDLQLIMKFLPYSPRPRSFPTSESGKLHSFDNGSIILHTVGFEEFLEMQDDPVKRLGL